MHSHTSLIDTFMRGAAWTAAKRFIYSLPMPVVLALAAVALFLYVMRAAGKGGRVSRMTGRTVPMDTVVEKRDKNGNLISTTTTRRMVKR